MKISDLPLPGEAIEFYLNSGLTELYPPQAQAIEKGILEGKNLIAAIPTASGKTLLAEFAMLRSILGRPRGKALYIVPLRALASEKYERFLGFKSLGIKVGISTGDYDRRDERLGYNDIIVATSEKADSLLRNESPWMDEITVVVADEIHLLDSPDRGPTLEVTLAKLMDLKPQIIGLSATIGNAEEVSRWLDAELVLSDWRPVELREGVFFGNAINFRDGQREVKRSHKDEAISLVLDTLAEGGQCLLFESSRRNAESVARRIGEAIANLEDLDRRALSSIASEMRETSEVETVERLASCIEMGSAFHHAGLLSEQRRLVENGFRENIIKVIASTPTLAAGLNLPARRVIIRGYRRYDPNYGSAPIPVLEYKQMAGRAGRPRLDPYGEAVLIAKTYEELNELMEHYVLAGVENIWSKLGSENALRTHVLSAIATRYAGDEKELIDFMGSTFYGCQQEPWGLKQAMDNVLAFLTDKEMIIDSQGLHPTKLGRLVSRLYVDPSSAAIIVEGLRGFDKNRATDLSLLHLICRTLDMRHLYLRSREFHWLADFASEHMEEFLGEIGDYEWFLSEVKTAWVLLDWINEKHEDDITKKFGIGQGDIRALAEIAQWLMHSLAELSFLTKTGFTKHARELEERLAYGASSELLELIQIRGIGRVRARKLYNAGYTNIEKLRKAEAKKIASLLGVKTAQKILKEIGKAEVLEVPELEEQRRLGDF